MHKRQGSKQSSSRNIPDFTEQRARLWSPPASDAAAPLVLGESTEVNKEEVIPWTSEGRRRGTHSKYEQIALAYVTSGSKEANATSTQRTSVRGAKDSPKRKKETFTTLQLQMALSKNKYDFYGTILLPSSPKKRRLRRDAE